LGDLARVVFPTDEDVAEEFAGFRVGGDVRSVSARFVMAVCFLAGRVHNFPNRLKTHRSAAKTRASAVITRENAVKPHTFDSLDQLTKSAALAKIPR
jgi:hypothetical protein